MNKKIYLFDIENKQICGERDMEDPEKLIIITLGSTDQTGEDMCFVCYNFDGVDRCYGVKRNALEAAEIAQKLIKSSSSQDCSQD